MSFEKHSTKSDLIESPLWDLILSTNDCYHGCGCDDDFFDMTFDRVKNGVITHRESNLIPQIDQLLSNDNIEVGEIQIQTNLPFQTVEEFKKWLLEWKNLIKGSQ